jgi:hypothetical protein
MTNFIKLTLVAGATALLAGCYGIGVETIAPREQTPAFPKVRNHTIRSSENFDVVCLYDLSSGKYVVFSPDEKPKHKLPPDRWDYGTKVTTTQEITSILGQPDKQSKNTIRYNTNRRSWRGFALDAAVFPIPLTVPLMFPMKKDGYIDFVFDEHGIARVIEYGSTSKFYGFWGDDSGSGFSTGTKSGFWFGK